MNKRGYLLTAFLIMMVLMVSGGQAQAREGYNSEFMTVTRSMPIDEIVSSKQTCIECHSKVTPRVIDEYKASAHWKVGLNCETCHGKNHKNMPLVTGRKVCIKCHQGQTKEMLSSKHGQSWTKMWDNGRYWSQPTAMRQQGCARCHDISYGFNDVRCDYCHTTHEFSVKEAKEPSACTICHMGPDHPQAEAYGDSAHGLLAQGQNNNQPGTKITPTCVTCHQRGGNHNVSINIGIGGVSNGGALQDWNWLMDNKGKPMLKRTVISEKDFQKARDGNLQICNQCHSPQFNQQWLNGADQVKVLVDQQLLEAEGIIKQLYKEGLIYPNPATRPGNPIDGQKLVLGGNQLYTGTSKAEAIYFEMYKFAAAQSWKSAYHQNFQRAGNNGIRKMDSLMKELKEEAKVLRLLGPVNSDLNKKQQVNKTDQNSKFPYWMFIAAGVLLGGLAAFLTRKRDIKILNILSCFLLMSLLLVLFNTGNKAMAWNGLNKDQGQCINCHSQQDKELKVGNHSGLKCLDCHEFGAGLDQVRKPETCGKCHSGKKDYALETYMSSPHGIQYKNKGINKWVPTCATCHMPLGIHSLKSKLVDSNNETKGYIGEVCLRCHITDEVIKFSNDKAAINDMSNVMVKELKNVGIRLIDKGILISSTDKSLNPDELKKKWVNDSNWTMVNIKKLNPEEQVIADKLVKQLIAETQKGVKEFAPQMRIGTAHVSPDYAHWYGNAYLNLSLSKAKSTGLELEMLAEKAGNSFGKTQSASKYKYLWGSILSLIFGVVTFYTLHKI